MHSAPLKDAKNPRQICLYQKIFPTRAQIVSSFGSCRAAAPLESSCGEGPLLEQFQVWLIRRMTKRRLGHVVAPVEALTSHPGLLIAYAKFGVAQNRLNLVDARLKALGIVRAAKLVECPF